MARVSAEHKFIFVNKVDSLIVTTHSNALFYYRLGKFICTYNCQMCVWSFVGVRFNIKIPSYG